MIFKLRHALSATLAVLLLAGSASAADKPKVITTFTVIADMAQQVAGDHAIVESITKPGAEIHNYQPTPRDIMRARDADLVLRNGLNLESWFEKFLAHIKDVPSATLSEGVEPIAIGGGAYEGKPNPHAWMSPDAALIYVANIEKALAALDPPNAGAYAENARAYSQKIRDALEPARQRIAALPPERRWLVTSEGAFSYLARDFGLKELFLWPVNADQQGTPQQVRHVIDTVRAEKIGTVFSESTISPEPAKEIARETGAHYGGILYVDSLSEPDGPVPTYLDLLTATAGTIAEGLSR